VDNSVDSGDKIFRSGEKEKLQKTFSPLDKLKSEENIYY